MNPTDLDRWITGNYGEDQFEDECECEDCTDPEGLDRNDPEWYTDPDGWYDLRGDR